jgi:hypothetical protein
MKKILISLFGILVLVGVTPFISPPFVREAILELQCSQDSPNTGCLKNIRELGHIRSRRGDLEKARHWYERGVGHGDVVAMFHLAWLHEELAIQNTAGMIQHLSSLAKLDTDNSRKELLDTVMSLAGRHAAGNKPHVDPNWGLARYWYERSAKLGFAPSMNNLGQLFLSGRDGVRDAGAAYRWHLAAAQAGNPVGGMNVAIAYSFGHGVEIDREEHKKWSVWTPAANIEEDVSEPTLARTRLFGSTIPQDIREKIRLSARLGQPFRVGLSKMEPNPNMPTFRRVGTDAPLPSR